MIRFIDECDALQRGISFGHAESERLVSIAIVITGGPPDYFSIDNKHLRMQEDPRLTQMNKLGDKFRGLCGKLTVAEHFRKIRIGTPATEMEKSAIADAETTYNRCIDFRTPDGVADLSILFSANTVKNMASLLTCLQEIVKNMVRVTKENEHAAKIANGLKHGDLRSNASAYPIIDLLHRRKK